MFVVVISIVLVVLALVFAMTGHRTAKEGTSNVTNQSAKIDERTDFDPEEDQDEVTVEWRDMGPNCSLGIKTYPDAVREGEIHTSGSKTMLSGGCYFQGDHSVDASYPITETGWYCKSHANDNHGVKVYAVTCDLPEEVSCEIVTEEDNDQDVVATCNDGQRVMGGGCQGNGHSLDSIERSTTEKYVKCEVHNNKGDDTITAHAICCDFGEETIWRYCSTEIASDQQCSGDRVSVYCDEGVSVGGFCKSSGHSIDRTYPFWDQARSSWAWRCKFHGSGDGDLCSAKTICCDFSK